MREIALYPRGVAGALGDQIGARKAFVVGFGLFILASLGCGLAPDAAALIIARTVQGVGAALLAGVLNSVRQAGGALGVALFGALLDAKAVPGARMSLSISAALLATAGIIAAVGIRSRKEVREE